MNLANLYKNRVDNDQSVIRGDLADPYKYASAETKYDKYKDPSIFSVDYKEFKGLEDVYDMKKFDVLKAYDTGKIKVYKI